jgi:8-oxo-dGTP diphosphatase
MKYCYEYPRPAVTADCAVITKKDNRWLILLIERKDLPYKGFWALPGGFLEMDETLEQCACRELLEETSISDVHLLQVHTFSDLERDPRGRTVSVLFYGYADYAETKPKAGDDAKNVSWFPLDELPHLAFDHQLVIDTLLKKIELK